MFQSQDPQQITYLIDGVQLKQKQWFAVTVNASYDETKALANMNSFVTSQTH